MKIVTVIGARPQFIKAAAVSRVLRKQVSEVFIHTGQHYDENMSDLFFDELSIPKPDYNLGVGSGSHAKQTANMMIGIEEILNKEKPDYVLVYGDTNSTLAAAITASKIHIPVIHVEAGLRSFDMRMPEEQNRVLADHVSKCLFCPTNTAVDNLKKEGIIKNVYNVGDVMCDAVLYYSKDNDKKTKDYFFDKLKSLDNHNVEILDNWYLTTIHRAENTDDIEKLHTILNALNKLDEKVIFPVHPRIRDFVDKLVAKYQYDNVLFVQPIGYLEMLYFNKNAIKVVTDSGGLQKEAYILNTPCVTIRDTTEWVETLKGDYNILSSVDEDDIIKKVNILPDANVKKEPYYGDGHASEKIVEVLTGGGIK